MLSFAARPICELVCSFPSPQTPASLPFTHRISTTPSPPSQPDTGHSHRATATGPQTPAGPRATAPGHTHGPLPQATLRDHCAKFCCSRAEGRSYRSFSAGWAALTQPPLSSWRRPTTSFPRPASPSGNLAPARAHEFSAWRRAALRELPPGWILGPWRSVASLTAEEKQAKRTSSEQPPTSKLSAASCSSRTQFTYPGPFAKSQTFDSLPPATLSAPRRRIQAIASRAWPSALDEPSRAEPCRTQPMSSRLPPLTSQRPHYRLTAPKIWHAPKLRYLPKLENI